MTLITCNASMCFEYIVITLVIMGILIGSLLFYYYNSLLNFGYNEFKSITDPAVDYKITKFTSSDDKNLTSYYNSVTANQLAEESNTDSLSATTTSQSSSPAST